jgi:peptidoglycan/xylan/chitin deacetylase (PgdA/CDA1 family)
VPAPAGLEGDLQTAERSLDLSFEAADAAHQDEVEGGSAANPDPGIEPAYDEPTSPPSPLTPRLDGSARTVAIVEALRRKQRASPVRQTTDLIPLRAALDRAAENGRTVELWWRDDDAVSATPALDRLLALADGAPLLIAAIPAGAEPSLARRLATAAGVSVAVHGLAHADHAPPGEKAAEFGAHRPLSVLHREATEALRRARERLPAEKLLKVFVPPWNRIAPDLARDLPLLGYTGLSAAGGPSVPGLTRADCTLDVIDWRGTRSLRDPARLLATLSAHAEAEEEHPLGLTTHHLAHDEAVWEFLAKLIPVLKAHPAVRLRDPRDLFGPAVDAGARTPISVETDRPRAV